MYVSLVFLGIFFFFCLQFPCPYFLMTLKTLCKAFFRKCSLTNPSIWFWVILSTYLFAHYLLIYLPVSVYIDRDCSVCLLISTCKCAVQSFSCVFYLFDKVEYRFMICRDHVFFLLYLSEVHNTELYTKWHSVNFLDIYFFQRNTWTLLGTILFVRIVRGGDLLMLIGDFSITVRWRLLMLILWLNLWSLCVGWKLFFV